MQVCGVRNLISKALAAAVLAGCIGTLANLLCPRPLLAGPCYSLDPDVYCQQCPSAMCDPACSAYPGTYDPCECDLSFPCDPSPCLCEPPDKYSATICLDPESTWVGKHVRCIIAFGSDYPYADVGVCFVANDQPVTCFGPKGCPDTYFGCADPAGCLQGCWLIPYGGGWSEGTPSVGVRAVPGGQVQIDGIFATENWGLYGHYYCTAALATLCGTDGVVARSSFVEYPILMPAQGPVDPLPMCVGSMIRLSAQNYCWEAEFYSSGSNLELYRHLDGTDQWEKIDWGQRVAHLWPQGYETWAKAVSPGPAEITLIGVDSWQRTREANNTLRIKVVAPEGCNVCTTLPAPVELSVYEVPLSNVNLNLYCRGRCGLTEAPDGNTESSLQVLTCAHECEIHLGAQDSRPIQTGVCTGRFADVADGPVSHDCCDPCCQANTLLVRNGCRDCSGGYDEPMIADSTCVLIHEAKHVQIYRDYLEREANRLVGRFRASVSGDPPRPTCEEAEELCHADIQSAVNSAYEGAWFWTDWAGESLPEDAERPCNQQSGQRLMESCVYP